MIARTIIFFGAQDDVLKMTAREFGGTDKEIIIPSDKLKSFTKTLASLQTQLFQSKSKGLGEFIMKGYRDEGIVTIKHKPTDVEIKIDKIDLPEIIDIMKIEIKEHAKSMKIDSPHVQLNQEYTNTKEL